MMIDNQRMIRDIRYSLDLLRRWVEFADSVADENTSEPLYSETTAWLESLK